MKAYFKRALWILSTAVAATALVIATVIWWGLRDTTIYADGFTEMAFQEIELGMGLNEVYSLVGHPLGTRQEDLPERWLYSEAKMIVEGGAYIFENIMRTPRRVSFTEAGLVSEVTGEGMAGVQNGMTHEEVLALLGEPIRRRPAIAMTLHYSEQGGAGLFRARIVAIDAANHVCEVISYEFYD